MEFDQYASLEMTVENAVVEEELETSDLSDGQIPVINTQTIVVQISGRLGLGKTWSLVSELFSACEAYNIELVITNVRLTRNPPNVKKVIYTTDVREVFKNLDGSKRIALAMDEVDKSISSRLAKSNWNLFVTRLMGDLRKSGCRWFGFTHQARKASDSLLRTNNSHIIYPRHCLNVDGLPMYWAWNDNEAFELDFQRGEGRYEYAVPMTACHTLAEIDSAYNTFEKIPLQLSPGLSEEEVPGAVDDFLSFCSQHSMSLSGQKVSIVKMYLKRWNENSSKNSVPYTPKALEIMLSELIAKGILDFEKEEASEPEPPELKSTAVLLHCQKCNYEWKKRTHEPKRCPNPKCQSVDWNRETEV